VLVYGGIKTFDGMDRHVWDNLILFAGASPFHSGAGACYHALQSTRNVSSAHTHFFRYARLELFI
jgi:hypothetical protein